MNEYSDYLLYKGSEKALASEHLELLKKHFPDIQVDEAPNESHSGRIRVTVSISNAESETEPNAFLVFLAKHRLHSRSVRIKTLWKFKQGKVMQIFGKAVRKDKSALIAEA